MGCDTGTSVRQRRHRRELQCQALSTGTPSKTCPSSTASTPRCAATSTGLALVWHDRVRRTLRGSAYDAAVGAWRAPFAIDGFDAVGTGDAGYNADLFVTPRATGTWPTWTASRGAAPRGHHRRHHRQREPHAHPQLVDDGTRHQRAAHRGRRRRCGGAEHRRGAHRLSGRHQRRGARRHAARGIHELDAPGRRTRRDPIDSEDSTGFWTCQALIGDTSHMATWWFNITEGVNGTRVFTLP
jgi:hypothetical protein